MESQDETPVDNDETGLEGPMRRLVINSRRPEPYPQRPGEPECSHYLGTGFCDFGSRCRFNHPRRDDRIVANEALHSSRGEYQERICQAVTQQCTHYLKTGWCKFGAACKFHHPPLPFYQQFPRPTMLWSPYFPRNYGPIFQIPQGIVTSWTPYPLYAIDQPTTSAGAGYYERCEYPQRPGKGVCRHYLRTGECDYGPSCKFHHPPRTNTGFVLGPAGLPLRPGSPICYGYSRKGACRFGALCIFDHPTTLPMNRSCSTSSSRVGPINDDDWPSSSSSRDA